MGTESTNDMASDGAGASEFRSTPAPVVTSPVRNRNVEQDGVSLLELLDIFLRHWRLLIGLPIALLVLALAASFLVTPTYTASASFVPEGQSATGKLGDLAGLAGQLGISIGPEANQSPRFYAQIVQSRELLEGILNDKFPLGRREAPGTDSVVLLHFLNARGRTPAKQLDAGVRVLRKHITADVDNQTNIITLSVDASDPVVASAVANRLIHDVDVFNLERRQSTARQRRLFIEQRLGDARQALRVAEDAVAAWLQQNRSYATSPTLQAEYQRLERQANIQQQVYLTLSQQYETARIEEVNSTPMITVIDSAVPPQSISKPNRKLWGLGALLAGGVLAIVATFTGEFFDRARREQAKEFEHLDRILARMRRTGPRGRKRKNAVSAAHRGG